MTDVINFPWNKFAFRVDKPIKGTRNHDTAVYYGYNKQGKPTVKLTVRKVTSNVFEIQARKHHKNVRYGTEITRRFTKAELVTMFDINELVSFVTDKEYALQIGAHFAIPGTFARRDDTVAFPHPGTGHRDDAVFYFKIMSKPLDRMRTEIRNLIETGDIRSK
jgi:hypothetical protein